MSIHNRIIEWHEKKIHNIVHHRELEDSKRRVLELFVQVAFLDQLKEKKNVWVTLEAKKAHSKVENVMQHNKKLETRITELQSNLNSSPSVFWTMNHLFPSSRLSNLASARDHEFRATREEAEAQM